jgi:MFS family permease
MQKYFSTALDGNPVYTAWLEIGFLVTASVTQRFFVAVAEVVGHRCVLFTAVISYTIGAVLCSTAFIYIILIVGRCVQGFGAGGMVAMMLVVVKDIFPDRPRPFYAVIIFGFGAIGAALGPVVGSTILERTSWKTLFYITIPFSGLLLLAIPWLNFSSEELVEGRQFLAIDWTGGIMFTGSLVSLLLGLTWGGQLYPWTSWRVILTLAAGGLGLVATLVYEKSGASQPFIRFRILKLAPAAYFCIFLNGVMVGHGSHATLSGREFRGPSFLLVLT